MPAQQQPHADKEYPHRASAPSPAIEQSGLEVHEEGDERGDEYDVHQPAQARGDGAEQPANGEEPRQGEQHIGRGQRVFGVAHQDHEG